MTDPRVAATRQFIDALPHCRALGMALVDLGDGRAVIEMPYDPRFVDYMRAATPGQTIRAEATCYHITRSVAFVRAVAMDDDTENPVASATGAFTIEAKRARA